MKKTRILIIALIIIAGVVIASWMLKSTEKKPDTRAITVRTVSLSSELPIKKFRIAGTTQSAETAVLRFQVSGRVTSKFVRLGDAIAKGDILVQLYNPELEPLIQAAKDNLARLIIQSEQVQRDFSRIDNLYKEQAVTMQEWETTSTRLTASQKEVSGAKSELDRATQVAGELNLVAPFAGSITEILIDVGEVVAAGSPAIRLSNPDIVQLELAVSDTILSQIKLGQTVEVSKALQSTGLSILGVVSEISPHRERGSLPEIIISLDANKIGPGVAVNATIEIQAKEGLSIPMRSVLMTGDDTVAVYRVNKGVAKLVAIRPTQVNANSVVIEQGLTAGDSLVVEGLPQLFDGARVVEADVEENDQANIEPNVETSDELNQIEAAE